jgi:hypothetical protein
MATATATMDNTKAMLEELRKPPEAVLDQIIGKKVDGTVKWVRRGLPLFVRYVLGNPAVGSILGLLNLYYGAAQDIIRANQMQHKAARYWGFLWALKHFFFAVSKGRNSNRFRVVPAEAWAVIMRSSAYAMQQQYGVGINQASVRAEVQRGIVDAATVMNELMKAGEAKVAASLLPFKGHVPQAELTAAYLKRVHYMRTQLAERIFDTVTKNIPAKHVQHLLGY